MATENVDELYSSFFALANDENDITDHEDEYLKIIKAVRSTPKKKLLASQFITRFFHRFPQLAEIAIEAFLDLCEDEDVLIRKRAIKDLPDLCKISKEYTPKIVNILWQLFAVQDPTELEVVHESVVKVIKCDPSRAIKAFFSEILQSEDKIRENYIKVLETKLKSLSHDVITSDIQDLIISECKKVLEDVSAGEFHSIMGILSWTKLGSTDEGKRELLNIITNQAELHVPFAPTDLEQSNRLIICIECALPYFNFQRSSSKFISYIFKQILSDDSVMQSLEEKGILLKILQLLADIIEFFEDYSEEVDKLEDINQKLYILLIKFMPLPPEAEAIEKPKLHFTHVECLIYAYHKIQKINPQFLLAQSDQELRIRLLYFARETMEFIGQLQKVTKEKSENELRSNENQLIIIALKATNNIHTLIKDFFYKKPNFNTVVQPSWKMTVADEKVVMLQEKHSPDKFLNKNNNWRNKKSNNADKHIGRTIERRQHKHLRKITDLRQLLTNNNHIAENNRTNSFNDYFCKSKWESFSYLHQLYQFKNQVTRFKHQRQGRLSSVLSCDYQNRKNYQFQNRTSGWDRDSNYNLRKNNSDNFSKKLQK